MKENVDNFVMKCCDSLLIDYRSKKHRDELLQLLDQYCKVTKKTLLCDISEIKEYNLERLESFFYDITSQMEVIVVDDSVFMISQIMERCLEKVREIHDEEQKIAYVKLKEKIKHDVMTTCTFSMIVLIALIAYSTYNYRAAIYKKNQFIQNNKFGDDTSIELFENWCKGTSKSAIDYKIVMDIIDVYAMGEEYAKKMKKGSAYVMYTLGNASADIEIMLTVDHEKNILYTLFTFDTEFFELTKSMLEITGNEINENPNLYDQLKIIPCNPPPFIKEYFGEDSLKMIYLTNAIVHFMANMDKHTVDGLWKSLEKFFIGAIENKILRKDRESKQILENIDFYGRAWRACMGVLLLIILIFATFPCVRLGNSMRCYVITKMDQRRSRKKEILEQYQKLKTRQEEKKKKMEAVKEEQQKRVQLAAERQESKQQHRAFKNNIKNTLDTAFVDSTVPSQLIDHIAKYKDTDIRRFLNKVTENINYQRDCSNKETKEDPEILALKKNVLNKLQTHEQIKDVASLKSTLLEIENFETRDHLESEIDRFIEKIKKSLDH